MQNPGMCIATNDVCKNRNGMSACDDAGVLYQCGDNGVVRSMMRCGSKELCMPGIMTGMCAKCPPSEFRCVGTALEQCDQAGNNWREMRRCDSAELCSARDGKCNEPACNPGQKTCMGDVLQECRPDRTGFQKLRDCPQGQCDANGGTCRACMPGAKRCLGTMEMTCDPQGMRETSKDCLPGRCENNQCVDCVGNATQNCGSGNQQGECKTGTQMCRNGKWSECMGNVEPTPEMCNGKDDDCDGTKDDNVTDCGNGMCINGKCGCRDNGQCNQGQGEICVDGNCAKPYTSCGSCPDGLTCAHGLCVPKCGNGCPNTNGQGFMSYPACGNDVGLDDSCVLVCQAPLNPMRLSCPQNTNCREAGDSGYSICQR